MASPIRYGQPPPPPPSSRSPPYQFPGYLPTGYANEIFRLRNDSPLRNDNLALIGPQGLEHEVFQHGTIGEFITSSIEGVDSGFLRCIYRAKNDPNHTVTLLCEKIGGCCVTGCCPKDQFWMTALIILLIFVLLVFCGGALVIIFCYQRSKNSEKRETDRAESANSGATLHRHDNVLSYDNNKIDNWHFPFDDYPVNNQHTLRRTY